MLINEDGIRRVIEEELTKQEVRAMIDSKLESFIKERELKKAIRQTTVDVISDFFREMWRKDGFWKNSLKNS